MNDSVYVRNFGRGEKWIPGQIVESTGPVSYKIKTNDGVLMRRHADHVKVTYPDVQCEPVTYPDVQCEQVAYPNVQYEPENPIKGTDKSTPAMDYSLLHRNTGMDYQPVKDPVLIEAYSSEASGVTNQPLSPNPGPVTSHGVSSPVPLEPVLRRSNRTIKVPNKLDL